MRSVLHSLGRQVVGVLFAVTVAPVSAYEVPTTGLVFNTKEFSSLVYRCTKAKGNGIDCEFTQTSVRKKSKPEDLAAALTRGRDEFKSGISLSAEECKTYSEMLMVFEGKKAAPTASALKEMSVVQKNDALAFSKALVALCGAKTEDNYLQTVRLSHDKRSRTCNVSSNTFRQSFTIVADGGGAWVTPSKPEGPCGTVQLSRFEPEKMQGTNYIVWKFVARKAITNPGGTLLGQSCKGLDQGEYVYDWKARELAVGCDYIEFSPI